MLFKRKSKESNMDEMKIEPRGCDVVTISSMAIPKLGIRVVHSWSELNTCLFNINAQTLRPESVAGFCHFLAFDSSENKEWVGFILLDWKSAEKLTLAEQLSVLAHETVHLFDHYVDMMDEPGLYRGSEMKAYLFETLIRAIFTEHLDWLCKNKDSTSDGQTLTFQRKELINV